MNSNYRTGEFGNVTEIVSSPQAKAYDGVKHFDSQKESELRGEAHRRPKII